MSAQLDPEILAAITAEARQCFLDEDAPEYLQLLNEGLQDRQNPDFTALLRAAHSLKGGAGLASMTSLQQLAHKMEDVLVGLQQSQISETELAWALVEKSIDEVGFIVSQAHSSEEAIANPELIIALESLAGSVLEQETVASQSSGNNYELLKTALTEELEESFVVIEELELDTPAEMVQPLLGGWVDECSFLAETLELQWLAQAVSPISKILEEDVTESILLAQETVANLRTEIATFLENLAAAPQDGSLSDTSENFDLAVQTLTGDLEELCQAISDLEMDTPETVINEAISSFADECSFMSETLELPWLFEAIAPIEEIVANCDSLEALLTVQELVGDIRQSRDNYLSQIANTDSTSTADQLMSSVLPEKETAFLEPQETYTAPGLDDLEIEGEGEFFAASESEETAELSTVMFAPKALSQDDLLAKVKEAKKPVVPKATTQQVRISLEQLEFMTNNVEELILSQSRLSRQQRVLNQANRRLRLLTRQFEPIREQIQDLYNRLAINSLATEEQNNEFDSLEMDRYTELHSSLQSFQELMLQIQETRTDIDFIDREFAEDLEHCEKNLGTLYGNVTDSRLVPFDTLAKRFIPQIRGLSQRFDKLVDLKIEGKNTLVDQILLEQLQTPLTHLLNNAFDHGIEAKYDRLAAHKPETATIILKAQLQNNQLVITIQDDGSGINPEKVFRRAVERGICPPDKSIGDFRSEEIVNWIFEPDFSTAAKVSDISGRGMGLDIVLNLIRQLRGQLFVTTDVGQGSIFTINLPLNLSLQSLMLVQFQGRLIAIPHTSILEILPYAELNFTEQRKGYIQWQDQTIPLASVSDLFPCPRQPINISQGKVGIILQTASSPIAMLADGIVAEEKLIIKPFDETVPVPTSIVGCTILGSGEIIPVILPQGIAKNELSTVSVGNAQATVASSVSTVLIAEDSVATRRMLEKVLVAAGYQVLVCRDGQEALEQIEQYTGRIDLILSDIEMPRVNGFELLVKVRAQPAFKNTPIVMATSRTGDRHRQEAERLGATDYLGKPVQPQQLIETVANLVNK